MGRDRKDSLSSDDSLSKSDSLSSSEERQDNKNDRNNKQRSSSESLSSDDINKSKKDKKSKSSKDSKKDKEKEKKKEDKSKKSKKKISKEDKKDKKKKHKSGKDKKSKKEKKNKKDPKKYVQQPTSKASKRFGKYGIIKQIFQAFKSKINQINQSKEHAYEKRDEFQQWLADVKKLNIEALTQNEERRLFDDFIEDYNTASMPEQKYYDLVLWEQYLQSKQIGKKVKTNEEVGLDDEALKKLEREKQRQAFETQATAAALNQIYTQGNMASEIQETEAKRALMQQSYKIGDIEKALDIQKELVPEKKKPGQQG
ncbi:hypothetical protein ABPG72_022056 [Tetrahymena utriculariae]